MTVSTGRHPTLSVTITNYNYARFLGQNIESVQSQTFTDYELVIIDNASEDDSVAVIRRYARNDSRIRLIEHAQNAGPLFSHRESCDVARGIYRVQIDADDYVLDATAFERQVAMLDANPAMAFVYSAMTMVAADGAAIHVSRPYDGDVVLSGERALEAVLMFNLTHSGMMLRLDTYRRTAGYPDKYLHVSDMLLGVRLCEMGSVGYIDRELYAFRQHGSNVHLAPQRGVVESDVLSVIDIALSGPLGDRVPDVHRMRRRVVGNALVHLPTQYIFNGDNRNGWRLYWESVRISPLHTIAQRRTLSLVVRTLLGQRGHDAVARWARAIDPRRRSRTGA
jgi:glycosyltransferase involved in cell wall biosynthesis